MTLCQIKINKIEWRRNTWILSSTEGKTFSHGYLTMQTIIGRVTDFIHNKAHRDATPNDVANYLICITQGFITTFAGEPGTGKTSLCNILAKALGLATNAPQKRFVDIFWRHEGCIQRR